LPIARSGNGLALAPPWLPPSLEGLDLSLNRLVCLPDWLPLRLRALRLLALHGNCLTHVSDATAHLPELRWARATG